jgi:hypothetical protein
MRSADGSFQAPFAVISVRAMVCTVSRTPNCPMTLAWAMNHSLVWGLDLQHPEKACAVPNERPTSSSS